jgi:hypothetical protein
VRWGLQVQGFVRALVIVAVAELVKTMLAIGQIAEVLATEGF